MTQFYTYLHCKPNGDPFYVGKGHKGRATDFSHRNNHHKSIVAKHGKDNIGIFIFFCDSEEQAFSDEVHQITQLRTEGYVLANYSDGGIGGTKGIKHPYRPKPSLKGNKNGLGNKSMSGKRHTLETRLRMSLVKIGNQSSLGKTNWLGKRHTEETKAKISASKKGCRLSVETRLKMSLSKLGNQNSRKKEK